MDVECFLCGGKAARCVRTQMAEILAAEWFIRFLRNGGYDPDVYSGYAAGMGPERITILRHYVEDIRYFWEMIFDSWSNSNEHLSWLKISLISSSVGRTCTCHDNGRFEVDEVELRGLMGPERSHGFKFTGLSGRQTNL